MEIPLSELVKREVQIISNLIEKALFGKWTPGIKFPSSTVWWWEKTCLVRYGTSIQRRFSPILIIPPLMVKPEIFDLRPGHSFVEFLSKEGFDVFLVDFGIPKREDRSTRLEDYILDFIPSAVEKTLELTKSRNLTLLGWSMGGIMALLFTSITDKPFKIKNLVILASPVDYRKMFPFNILATLTEYPLFRAVDILGNIPPFFTKNGFRLLSPVGSILRKVELLRHLHDREWLSGYEAIENWIEGFIPYPGTAFQQFVKDFIIEDKMRKKRLYIGGKLVDLERIKCPLLVFSGTRDKVAPFPSVSAIVELVGSRRKKLIEVPLGHIGIIAGREAPELVWKPLANWLSKWKRSSPS